jgi:hypothetical protein
MPSKKLRACVTILGLSNLVLLVSGQVPTTAPTQPPPGSQITLPTATITAGDTLAVAAQLDRPAPCSVPAWLIFGSAPSGDGIQFNGTTVAGSTNLTLTATFGRDLSAGTYTSNTQIYTNPCPGYSKASMYTISPKSITVKAFPDFTQRSAKAEMNLSLTQKQFFDTKQAELDELNSELNTRLLKSSADLQDLRDYLINTVNQAALLLDTAERQYAKRIDHPANSTPAFFAEFRLQYSSLLIHLKAPIPGTGGAVSQTTVAPHLVFVNDHRKHERFTDTWPPSATAVSNLLTDNAAVYKFVSETGRLSFNAQLISNPSGAHVKYKKIIDTDFSDYASLTNVSDANFELATWIFVFTLDGCPDMVDRIDPYQYQEPVKVEVKFLHCKGRK